MLEPDAVKRNVYTILFTLVILGFFIIHNTELLAHGGRTNSQGCHNNTKTGDYHCHNSGSSKDTSSSSSNQSMGFGENQLNQMLAASLGGKTEVSIPFKTEGSGISSEVRIDIVTDEYVIEGGLDKRSSLDSIQQALFASSQTGKKPAVAIYDTDSIWGVYEHRIWVAAKAVNIKFIWVFEGNIVYK